MQVKLVSRPGALSTSLRIPCLAVLASSALAMGGEHPTFGALNMAPCKKWRAD